MAKKLNILGKRFGRIVITAFVGIKNRATIWEYTCDCGIVKTEQGNYLNAGRIQSCGCLRNERIGALKRGEWGASAKKRLLAMYKKGAKRRELVWGLSNEQFYNLTQLPCHYCGCLPFNTTEKISPNSYGHFTFNGIDRINDNIGYEINNCVPCCHPCNLAKNTHTYDSFLEWIKRMVSFWKDKI